MRGRSRRGADATSSAGFVGIAGWLFADLLLAMSLIFLVSIGIFTIPKPVGVTHASPSPSPSPSPVPQSRVCTKSIANKPRLARYDPPNHSSPDRALLIQAFGAAPGEEEGLVQTKVTDSDIDHAYRDAQSVNAMLAGAPGVTAGTHFDDLGWVDPRGDTWLIEFTIYPFAVTCLPL
jgi:hypothetical protein